MRTSGLRNVAKNSFTTPGWAVGATSFGPCTSNRDRASAVVSPSGDGGGVGSMLKPPVSYREQTWRERRPEGPRYGARRFLLERPPPATGGRSPAAPTVCP